MSHCLACLPPGRGHLPVSGRSPRRLGATALLVLILFPGFSLAGREPWKELDDGLALAEFRPGNGDDSRPPVTVLRIDPALHALKLLAASEQGGRQLTAREWSRRFKLEAAVNAGMYQADGITHVGYLKNGRHVNNPVFNAYRAVLAFDPVDPSLPPVQIIDRECQDLESMRGGYRTLVQNIRMVSCRRENVWARQEKAWIVVALAVDANGKVLLIHSGAAYPVHDFISIILGLPLEIKNAVYLEGGPVATFFLSAGGTERELTGATPAAEAIGGSVGIAAAPLPNIIGVVRR